MAHASRFITRTSRFPEHLPGPHSLWTLQPSPKQCSGFRLFSSDPLSRTICTHRPDQIWMKQHHQCIFTWSRAGVYGPVTSHLWPERWHATQRRGFSQHSERRSPSKELDKQPTARSVFVPRPSRETDAETLLTLPLGVRKTRQVQYQNNPRQR